MCLAARRGRWRGIAKKLELTSVNSLPPSQHQYRSKNKLNNQHQQRVAHCVEVVVHVRVDGLLGGSGECPEGCRP